MLDRIWALMILVSLGFCFVKGEAGQAMGTLLEGAGNAVSLVIRLCAGYAFFGGMMELVYASGASKALIRLFSPILRKLFPSIDEPDTRKAIIDNFVSNLLGLGNAATPAGMEAIRLMERDSGAGSSLTPDMRLFLTINATSIQLLPTTVMALRAAAGSVDPAGILLPTILSTTVSTVVGVMLCKLVGRRRR